MDESGDWGSGHRARRCGAKRRYPTRPDAKQALKRFCRLQREKLSRWQVYPCPYCGQFHIGHRMNERPPKLRTVAEAISFARRRYNHLSIPEAVDGPAADLEAYGRDDQRRWARRCTEALRSLNAYALAKHRTIEPFRGNFYTFCASSGAASVPVGSLSMNETRDLIRTDRLGNQRIFAVDCGLEADGLKLMTSHLILQRRGSPAPRLYFFDDSSRTTGKIHIGYVGRHLDTSFTGRSM